MIATSDVDNRLQAAKVDVDSARDHIDTAQYYLTDAVGYLEAARCARATEILDHVSAVLADLDRLRAAL